MSLKLVRRFVANRWVHTLGIVAPFAEARQPWFSKVFELYLITVRMAASELKFPKNAFQSPPVCLRNSIGSYNVPRIGRSKPLLPTV